MAKDIKETLKEGTKDLLSEDALNEIEQFFNAAVEERSGLHVEAALAKQDEDHATKVGHLLEAIDDDHTKKLKRIVEAINENHTQKLKKVVDRFKVSLNEEANEFKGSVVSNMSNYLDLYLEKVFPADMLEEALNNKRANNVLAEVRKLLAVDMALAKNEIRDAIVDGKDQINEASQKLDQVEKENETLKGQLESIKSQAVLEKLSSNLPDHKKKYVQKVLNGKKAEFITENFEYTLDLFDKEQETQNEVLVEEAKTQVKGNVDAVVEEVQVESVQTEQPVDKDPLFNTYMGELGKY